MNYTIEILNEKALKLLISLEEMHLIRLIKNPSSEIKTPQKKSFGGRISKKTANDLHNQLKEMRNEWERI